MARREKSTDEIIEKYLGQRAKEKVTGLEGVVTSIAFDLYGCVQVALNPGIDKDGKIKDSYYFDENRLEVQSKSKRVMPLPDFGIEKGPEDHSRISQAP